MRVRRFAEQVREIIGGDTVEANHLYDRHLFLIGKKGEDGLKIEFTHYPYTPLEQPLIRDGVRVEGLRDIATDKLAALLDRFEPKDYYDLYCLLHGNHTSLPAMRKDLKTKFHIIADSVQLGAALARAERLPILPHMLTPVRKEDVQKFFEQLAKKLTSEIIKG